jgi:DNA sulfur modification protein DndC
MARMISLFDDQRLTLADSIALTIASLTTYAERYHHWCIAYSGGKDSTAVVSLVTHLIATGQIPTPDSLTVLYADTRMELPPLHINAMQMLDVLRERGVQTHVVLPPLNDRYFVYMFGRGVPPPNNNTLRWCTSQIKIEPMQAAMTALRDQVGEKLLMLTGVRLGESAARDARIALSCSKNGAECGQGWLQVMPTRQVYDVLAPLIHFRVCHVWDWLMFDAPALGFPTAVVARAYGGEEATEINARTGCIGCPLAEEDTALDYILTLPEWSYLAPLKQLRPLYRELRLFKHRLQKAGERNKDGRLSANPNRKGPLTMDARRYGLETVLRVQAEVNAAARAAGRPTIHLINEEEHARILELIDANTWPQRWTGDEPRGDLLIPQVLNEETTQPLLIELEQNT